MGKRILYFFIIFAAACLLLGCDGPEDGLTGQAEPTVTGIQEIQTQTSKTSDGAEHYTGESLYTQDLEVHFLDVGQADSALVLCGEKSMLIDGGNVADSRLVAAYLSKLAVKNIDYVICTHPHEDHVGGLSGALSVAAAGKVLAPAAAADTKAYQSFLKKVSGQGLSVEHPAAGDQFQLGGSTVEIFGPVQDNDIDLNNTSIVLKITYGQTSFLFAGDAEFDEEHDIIAKQFDLKSTVLKVGHHGSDTSSSYVFLREVQPQYAVISVGKNNAYGHPGKAALSRLRDVGAKVFRTDVQGDIICKSDGQDVAFTTAKNTDAVTNSTEIDGSGQNVKNLTGVYIGNTNSKRFHLPSCQSLPKEENRVMFCSRSGAVEAGFKPCGNCNP